MSARPVPGGGDVPALAPETFARLAAALRGEAGIQLPESKGALVVSRLARRLRALGLPDFESYAQFVAEPGGAGERRAMVEALTTNHTFFGREPHHFEHLRAAVLPDLARRARGGGRVRLWCAGCSTGPEAWTIALNVHAALPDAGALDVRVLATDIDRTVLATAREGRYEAEALEPLGPAEREAGFEPAGAGALSARPALRDLLRFRELNLLAEWPMRGTFDAVFFRNVAIYFDQPLREALWHRMAERIRPGGFLYAGHSERLTGPAAALFAHEGLTTYRRLPA